MDPSAPGGGKEAGGGRLQQMKVKVLFTLHGPSYPVAPQQGHLTRIARLADTCYVTPRTLQLAEGGDVVLGDVSAKTCLYGVAVSQPELLLDANRDYSLAVLDVAESTARKRARKMARPFSRSVSSTGSSPADDMVEVQAESPTPSQLLMPDSHEKPKGDVFEGKGMMRWVMQERGEGKTMLTGRVVKRAPGDLVDTIELTLRLTERPAVSRGDFVENMRSLANPPATPGNPSPHLNSPSADGFLSRLFRNEVTGRGLGSPPQIVTARAPAPAAIQLQPPSLPPEIAQLIREAMAPGGQPRANAAPELLQLANGILRAYGAPQSSTLAVTVPPPATPPLPAQVPKKRAALTTQPLPAHRPRQLSDEEQDDIAFAHSAGSSLAIRPSVVPSAAKRPRVEAAPAKPPLRQKTSASSSSGKKPPPPLQKVCSSCGTTESKRWSVMNPKKAESIEAREATRMCETCFQTKRPHQVDLTRKGSMTRTNSANSITQSSPPRSIGKRRISLPQAAATSPVRGPRRIDLSLSDDDDLPAASGLGRGRSNLFESAVIPPSSSSPPRGEVEGDHHLNDFILNASPGTALSRIIFAHQPEPLGIDSRKKTGKKAEMQNERTQSTLFSGHELMSDGQQPLAAEFDYSALLTSTGTVTNSIAAPASSSTGLTAADELPVMSSPLSLLATADIFGSPSKWAHLGSPVRGGADAEGIAPMMAKSGVTISPETFSYEALFAHMIRATP